MNKPVIVVAVTVGTSAYSFLRGQLSWFKKNGWHVTLVSNPDDYAHRAATREGVDLHGIEMERKPSPIRDARSFVRWLKFMRKLGPDAVSVGTPKAALLGSVSARVLRIPRRIYVVRGLRLEGTRGTMRKLLWLMEWVTFRASTDTFFISKSLYHSANDLGLTHKRPWLIGSGSSNGVDAAEIARKVSHADRDWIRRSIGVKRDDFLVGFVGRITSDKGIGTLIDAFRSYDLPQNTKLLVIGDLEEVEWVARISELGERAVRLPWTDNVWDYLAAIDVLSLPTKREGFGNVVLEAGAARVPTITTRATGAIDTVVDGVTGYSLAVGDSGALAARIAELSCDSDLVERMGNAAYERAVTEFAPERIWRGLMEIISGETSPMYARLANHDTADVRIRQGRGHTS